VRTRSFAHRRIKVEGKLKASEVAPLAAPSPARHGGCKKMATAAPLALSRYAGEGSERKRRLRCRATSGEDLQNEGLPIPTTLLNESFVELNEHWW
jgi:hypothetical protein